MAFVRVTHSHFTPALLRKKAAGGSWLWITPRLMGHGNTENNIKTAPRCNLIFEKNCLDKWVHLSYRKPQGMVEAE